MMFQNCSLVPLSSTVLACPVYNPPKLKYNELEFICSAGLFTNLVQLSRQNHGRPSHILAISEPQNCPASFQRRSHLNYTDVNVDSKIHFYIYSLRHRYHHRHSGSRIRLTLAWGSLRLAPVEKQTDSELMTSVN